LLFAFCGCGNHEARKLDVDEAAISCASSLRHIADAKIGWAKKNGTGTNDTPTADDLDPFFRHGFPVCPSGGTYAIGKVGELPQCSIAAHNEYYKAHQTPDAEQ
jgi:hypothetical protein